MADRKIAIVTGGNSGIGRGSHKIYENLGDRRS
jgi:NAD(P)-dependent dehydrogenase (short-subunit alcohol dehydrogenase family)